MFQFLQLSAKFLAVLHLSVNPIETHMTVFKFMERLHDRTLGARDFSCAVSGFGQVLKSDPREKLRRSCLWPNAEDMSACGRRSSSSHARKNLWYPRYHDRDIN